MPERSVAVRVDEELFKKVKQRIAEKNVSLKDYVINLLEEDVQNLGTIEKQISHETFTITREEMMGFLKQHGTKKC